MIDAIERVLLIVLPFSFVAKTAALGFMWWYLQYRTVPTGPLGTRINIAFRDQFIMSLLITQAMAILALEVDASEVDWPFVSLALAGIAIYPFRAAWSYYLTFRTYRRLSRRKHPRPDGPTV